MSNYIIGIGGTGARCVEATIHLAAAGVMPTSDLHILCIDPDNNNGNLSWTKNVYSSYAECCKVDVGDAHLFRTKVKKETLTTWSPCSTTNMNLADNFKFNNLSNAFPYAADLMRVLYSHDERTTSLSEGFRGRPSLGAAFMADAVDFENEEAWKEFYDRVHRDLDSKVPPRIVIVGSIFGGTGAAGIPTIAEFIYDAFKDNQQDLNIGAVLILPYFSFDFNDEGDRDGDLKADADSFQLRTEASLRYYHDMQYAENYFRVVYLLGDGCSLEMNLASRGGKKQKNEQHFIELYAGLAVADFFGPESHKGCAIIGTSEADTITWADLPYWEGSTNLKDMLGQCCSFCFAYLCAYELLSQRRTKGDHYTAPFLIDYFERDSSVSFSKVLDEELSHIKEYCRYFLSWVANIQESGNRIADKKVELFNFEVFARRVHNDPAKIVEVMKVTAFKIQEFSNILLPRIKPKTNAMCDLWTELSRANTKTSKAKGAAGKFLNALYTACATEEKKR